MKRPVQRRPVKVGRLDVGRWIYNLWLVTDQAANALLGGAPDETISGRLGRYKNSTGWRRTVGRPLAGMVDFFLGKDHCEETWKYELSVIHRPESLDDKHGD